MFETSQQEPGGGAAKIVGAAVAVAAVLMVVMYFLFVRGEPGTAPGTAAPGAMSAACEGVSVADAEPMRDLAIMKFNLGRDQTQTMALWDIQLANRSRCIAYREIQYATNYYDNAGNVIYQNQGALPGEIGPRDQRTITEINDGLYPLATTRYTIELKGAQAYQP